MDPDPDPIIFVIDPQDVYKKLILLTKNFLLIKVIFEGTFT
jgi:hypothetical protein